MEVVKADANDRGMRNAYDVASREIQSAMMARLTAGTPAAVSLHDAAAADDVPALKVGPGSSAVRASVVGVRVLYVCGGWGMEMGMCL